MAANDGPGGSGGDGDGGPTVTIIQYMECRRNYAAQTAGFRVDGCREFVKIADAAEENPESKICATCGCHRSFHRKEEFHRPAAANTQPLRRSAVGAGAPLPPLSPRPPRRAPRQPASAPPQRAEPQPVPPQPPIELSNQPPPPPPNGTGSVTNFNFWMDPGDKSKPPRKRRIIMGDGGTSATPQAEVSEESTRPN